MIKAYGFSHMDNGCKKFHFFGYFNVKDYWVTFDRKMTPETYKEIYNNGKDNV